MKRTTLAVLAATTITSLTLRAGSADEVFTSGEHGLWRLRFDDESTLSASDVSTNGVAGASCSEEPIEGGGVRQTYTSDDAVVTIERSPHPGFTDYRATVRILANKTAKYFDFPARLRFDRNTVARFSYPGQSNWGLGMAFNSKFFTTREPKNGKWWMSYGKVRYPNQFADFARLENKDGSSAAVFGVQPRTERAGWDNPVPFVPAETGVGADSTGGWYDHAFGIYLKQGDVWASPVVRIVEGGTLRDNLAAYAEANSIRKHLDEKVGDPALLERLKCAPLYLFGTNAALTKTILDRLPVPTLYHTPIYLKGGFDKEYPDHFPVSRENFGTDEDFRDIIDFAHAKGHLVCPYSNPTWWGDNPKGPTFAEKGEAALLVNLDGTHRHESYNKGKTEGWQVTVRHPDAMEANRKTIARFAGDFPVDFLFQDQVGARGWIYDLNPAARGATDMPESYIAMNEEDSQSVRLFTEDGWDKIAENNIGLCGCNWWIFPFKRGGKPERMIFKEKFPADCWEIEPITLYLAHDKCLFYSHNLGAHVHRPSLLAWTLACGYQMSYVFRNYENDEAERDWYAWLHLLQRLVVSRIAGQPLLAFKHDREPMIALGGDISRASDDGTITARYGDVDVVVNLGDVERTVAGHSLAPYGWWIEAPGLVAGWPAGQDPFVEADSSRFEFTNGTVSQVR